MQGLLWSGQKEEMEHLANEEIAKVWSEYSEGRLTPVEALRITNIINEKLMQSLEKL